MSDNLSFVRRYKDTARELGELEGVIQNLLYNIAFARKYFDIAVENENRAMLRCLHPDIKQTKKVIAYEVDRLGECLWDMTDIFPELEDGDGE